MVATNSNSTSTFHISSIGDGIASLGLRAVRNIAQQSELLVTRRAGRIVIDGGHLTAVHGRWWPYIGNHLRCAWDQRFRFAKQDRCEIFYHAPQGLSQFITISYAHSGAGTSLSSIFAGALVLDEIARLRRSVAIVCCVTNDRISDRLLERWGWVQHCLDQPGRHFIKRFYGNYPPIPDQWRQRLTMAPGFSES